MTKRTWLIFAGLASMIAIGGGVAIFLISHADDIRTRFNDHDTPPVGHEIAPNIVVSSHSGQAYVYVLGEGLLPRGNAGITRIASLDGFTVLEDRAGDSFAWFCIRADGAIARRDTVSEAAQHCGLPQQSLEGAFVVAGEWLDRHPPAHAERRRR